MLVKKPNKKELKPATAAVAVIRLRLRSARELVMFGSPCADARALFADEVVIIFQTQFVGCVVAYAVSAGVGENGGLVLSVRRSWHATLED